MLIIILIPTSDVCKISSRLCKYFCQKCSNWDICEECYELDLIKVLYYYNYYYYYCQFIIIIIITDFRL